MFFLSQKKEDFYRLLHKNNQLINVGTGDLISISKLAKIIKKVTEFKGEIIFDKTKPDGMPVKCLDNKIAKKMGWNASTKLKDGIIKTYEFYINENIYKKTKETINFE